MASLEGMTFPEADRLITDCGFIRGYHDYFKGYNDIYEEEGIYYMPNRGVIVYISTRGDIIDNAYMFGEISAPFDFNISAHHGFEECDFEFHDYTKTIEFAIPIVTDFVYKLDFFTMNFQFSRSWKMHSKFKFINYIDELNYLNSEYINASRRKVAGISHLRDIIFGDNMAV